MSAIAFLGARAKIRTTTADYTTVPVSELIRACVEGEAAAWQEFTRRFNRIIAVTSYRAARRWGEDSPAVVDDLTQEAYVKLCAGRARVLRELDSSALPRPPLRSIYWPTPPDTETIATLDHFRSNRGGQGRNSRRRDRTT